MEIDLGLDTLDLPREEQRLLHEAAGKLGYGRIWTAAGLDPFVVCAMRWADTVGVVPGGIGTGIGIAPVQTRSPLSYAQSAALLTRLTQGRFILGLGSGSLYSDSFRNVWGVEESSAFAITKAYLHTIRGLLAGEEVTYSGGGINYEGARMPGAAAASTPVYLGSLGPRMTRLAGEAADGIILSWSTAAGVDWARARLNEGAERAGRDPRQIRIATNVRVSIDPDVKVARRALAEALFPYIDPSFAWPAPHVYRPHIERAGFSDHIRFIDGLSEKGMGRDEIIENLPDELLGRLGYFGPASGAADRVRELSGAADVAIVRVVPARKDAASALAVMESCLSLTTGDSR